MTWGSVGLETGRGAAPGGRGNGLSRLWEVGETADSILGRISGRWDGCSSNVGMGLCEQVEKGDTHEEDEEGNSLLQMRGE